jgi:hypothetical protein
MPELKSENSSESTERMDGVGSWCVQNLTRIEREKLGICGVEEWWEERWV